MSEMLGTRGTRGRITALVLLGLLAAAGLIYLGLKQNVQPTPPTPPAIANAGIPAPQFDIVRVDPSGNTVIAGRAAPGATITIKRGDRFLGTAQADASGSFAYLPQQSLPPGPQQLTLFEQLPNGTTIQGQTSATLVIPAQPAGRALTVLSTPNGSQVLSAGAPQPGTLAIGTVDYDAAGHAIFSGTAAPGTHIVLSLGTTRIGGATAGHGGRWRFAAHVPTNDGTLNLTATDAHGGVLPAVTAPFALETLPTALAAGHVVIAPGQNLWLIAHAAYGQGNLYTLIYNANTQAIHNPDLIFPGQAFSMPKH